MKRAFDFLLALTGIIISFPLWVVFGFLIYIESGRPLFYLQERAGKGGRIFKIIKFRSMRHGMEKVTEPLQAKENDSRVTRIGRFLRAAAMDELPQLVNILRGDMSFVGPRASMLVEADANTGIPRDAWEFPGFSLRCSVRPGLTGVAQIFAPRDIPRNQKFKYDIWYIKNQSFWLDIYLIALSFLVTLRGRWETRGSKFSFMDR